MENSELQKMKLKKTKANINDNFLNIFQIKDMGSTSIEVESFFDFFSNVFKPISLIINFQ